MATSDEHMPWFERLPGTPDRLYGRSQSSRSASSEGDASTDWFRWAGLAAALMNLPLALLATHVLVAEPPSRLFGALMSCSFGFFLGGAGFGVLARENRMTEEPQGENWKGGGPVPRLYWWSGSAAVLCFVAGGTGFIVGLGVLVL